jgi:flavin-binding protein dodecin
VRLFEAQGASKRSWDAAVTDALRGAKDEVDSPLAVEIARQWADLDGRGRIATYRVSVKIAHRQVLAPPRS